jgi:hypothetical protein
MRSKFQNGIFVNKILVQFESRHFIKIEAIFEIFSIRGIMQSLDAKTPEAQTSQDYPFKYVFKM